MDGNLNVKQSIREGKCVIMRKLIRLRGEGPQWKEEED